METVSSPWRMVAIVVGHIVLAWLTIQVFALLEDTTSIKDVGFIVILVLTLPVSYLLSLCVFGGWPPRWTHWWRALIASGLLSPLSLAAWLTIYVNIVGYNG